MLKLIVTDSVGKVYKYPFNTQEELDAFKAHHESVNAWGVGYAFEIKDASAETELENLKKSDRVSRVSQLKAIDWATVDTVAELKAIVRILVKEAIKDDE